MKNKENLTRALGLIKGCLFIKELEKFNKEGLIQILEEVQQLLNEVIKND
jgi:hypothetical protein